MKYYITTPIYYVNAAPHIGHAYTTIVADLLRRFKRMQGYEAFVTTGSDEHGINVERAAERARKSPLEFCDVIAAEFAKEWTLIFSSGPAARNTLKSSRISSSGAAGTATYTRARTRANTASSTTCT